MNNRANATNLKIISGSVAKKTAYQEKNRGVRYKVDTPGTNIIINQGKLVDLRRQDESLEPLTAIVRQVEEIMMETRQAQLPDLRQNADVLQAVQENTPEPVMDSFFKAAPDLPENLLGEEKAALSTHLHNLANQENQRLAEKMHLEQNSEQKRTSLKNLGKGLFGALKSVVMAVPKLVEAFLPNSLQITPKIEIFEGLRKQKDNDIRNLQQTYERDLKEISSAYLAIEEYLKESYGRAVRRFDTTDQVQLSELVVECKFQKDSPHYQAVQEVIDKKIKDRTARYNEDLQKIQENNGSQENMDDMLQESWVLRTREKVKDFFSKKKVSKPASQFQNGGGEPPKRDKKKGLRTLLPAAVAGLIALGMGAIGGANKATSETNATDTTDASVTSTAQSGDQENNSSEIDWQPQTLNIFSPNNIVQNETEGDDLAVEAVPSTEPTQQMSTPATPDTVIANNAPETGTIKIDEARRVENNLPVNSRVAERPVIKSASIGNSKVIESKSQIPPQVAAENMETKDNITDLQPGIREIEAKISAFQRRLSELRCDDKILAPLLKRGSISMDIGNIPSELNQAEKRLKEVRNDTDITRLQDVMSTINSALTEAETTAMLVNVGEGLVPNNLALDLLKTTSTLSGSAQARFQLNYVDHSGKSVKYQVDLAQIQTKLQHNLELMNNTRSLTPYQARMARLDAEYWVNYLKFVNWHLQYNPNGIAPVST
jgi:hypothetical protein